MAHGASAPKPDTGGRHSLQPEQEPGNTSPACPESARARRGKERHGQPVRLRPALLWACCEGKSREYQMKLRGRSLADAAFVERSVPRLSRERKKSKELM
ncbi:uncharacterized protein C11orf52 homolog isoform X2 [Parus major]|uniref:uncharacterized protein C11orf52 homolog isoform X2 n=1 Tax=Parus major TaxID=9157 RepID=UPI001443C7FF|nr:uncharacterized protein C11orf52 homolog isoform X2 [Parus major]